ncbi:MAG: nitrate- and nitrite sensing domain-containing protein [Alphaproteobacteria bacterium]
MRALRDRIRVGPRILLASLVPLLGMFLAVSAILAERWQKYDHAHHVVSKTQILAHLGELAEALQGERSQSLLFLAGRVAPEGVGGSQRTSDHKYTELLAGGNFAEFGQSHPEFNLAMADFQAVFSELDRRRHDVLAREIYIDEATEYYSTAVSRLIGAIAAFRDSDTDQYGSSEISQEIKLIMAWEEASRERAIGSAGFWAGYFPQTQYRAFARAIAAEKAHLDAFLAYATQDEKVRFAEAMSEPLVKDVERMRSLALDAGPERAIASPDIAHWNEATGARILLLKDIAHHIVQTLSKRAKAQMTEAQRDLQLATFGAFIVLLLTAWICASIARGLARPLFAIDAAMLSLAAGDKTIDIPGQDRRDEIGDMARAAQVFKEAAIAAEQAEIARREEDRLRHENEIETERTRAAAEREREQGLHAEREATQQREAELRALVERQTHEARRHAMLELGEKLENTVLGVAQNVSSASGQIQGTASTMSLLAQSSSTNCKVLLAASTTRVDNYQQVATAAEQLYGSIGKITERVSVSTDIAARAVAEAKDTNAAIGGLTEAARHIADIANIIGEIASQTHLLALNATIEAARAGESGRGFAVVATEVKALATQTARATGEIATHIEAMRTCTTHAARAIESIGATIGEISAQSRIVSGAIEEQKTATRAIANNIGEAAAGTDDMSQSIAEITSDAEQVGQTASDVLSAAETMAAQSAELRAEIERLMSDMRAA